MSFPILFIVLLLMLGCYYIALIAFDIYTDRMAQSSKIEVTEEEIDIPADMLNFNVTEVSPFDIDITGNSGNLVGKKQENDDVSSDLLPFPWEVEKFYDAVHNLKIDEEYKELENVIYEIVEKTNNPQIEEKTDNQKSYDDGADKEQSADKESFHTVTLIDFSDNNPALQEYDITGNEKSSGVPPD